MPVVKRTIRVTELDIRCGHIDTTTSCAVARAVRRELPGSLVWIKYLDRVRMFIDGQEVFIPYRVARWIRDWDRGKEKNPIEFKIEMNVGR